MVMLEVALALVLLIGAGLMLRSLSALWRIDPGFQPENVLTFGLSFPASMRATTLEARHVALRDISDRLNAMPEVKAASFLLGASPMQNEGRVSFCLDNEPKPASITAMHLALVYAVEPGYLTAMGIPLKQGRFFTAQDETGTKPVVVIDEAFARQYFQNADPLGRYINLWDNRGPLEIVGVVGHVKQFGLDADDRQSLRAQLYFPFRQYGWNSEADVVVRADGIAGRAQGALLNSIRQVVQSQHSHNVIYEPRTMNDVIADSLARRRFSMILLTAFAAVALLLATIGIYGVISYLVGLRRQEFGIRLALGAQRKDVVLLVLSRGIKMTVGGVILGLIAALGLTRLLSTMLYGVSAIDLVTFAGTALLLTIVSLVACFVPAWRATRLDPLIALRYE
jgi:predicted permease